MSVDLQDSGTSFMLVHVSWVVDLKVGDESRLVSVKSRHHGTGRVVDYRGSQVGKEEWIWSLPGWFLVLRGSHHRAHGKLEVPLGSVESSETLWEARTENTRVKARPRSFPTLVFASLSLMLLVRAP